MDSTLLAKYMRCLFQIAISDDIEIAEQLLDQVQKHAFEAQDVIFALRLTRPRVILTCV